MYLFAPTLRALDQMDDPVFIGVVWRSVAWTLVGFVAVGALLAQHPDLSADPTPLLAAAGKGDVAATDLLLAIDLAN